MLRKTSIDLGVNLALIAHESKIALSPIANTLMGTLSSNVRYNLPNFSSEIYSCDQDYSTLKSFIERAAAGTTTRSTAGVPPSYAASSHDTLMDNYIPEYAKLISQHVVYARSVVYREMESFIEQMRGHAATIAMKQPEDLFQISYVDKHDVFNLGFLDTEISPYQDRRFAGSAFNYRVSLFTPEFDLLSAILTGDSSDDEVIKAWYAEVGGDKLLAYMTASDEFVYSIGNPLELMNYHLVNFLFFKSVINDPKLPIGLSVTALTALAAENRNAHASGLYSAMSQFDTYLKSGALTLPVSSGGFSYMSDKGVGVCIIETNFTQAAERGLTLEHLFGHIARSGSAELTIETALSQADELMETWTRQRSLYGVYMSQRRNTLLRDSMIYVLRLILDTPEHAEAMADVHGAQPGNKAMSVQLCESYLKSLDVNDIENFSKVALNVIAKIVHRHSNAHEIISGMMEVIEREPNVDPTRAVTVSIARYLTDYLMAQLTVN